MKNIGINREFLKNFRWARKQWNELTALYQGNWVAVFHARVIASGKNIASVERKVKSITHKRPFQDIPLFYVEDPHCIY